MRHAPTTFAFFSGCALLAALTCSRLAVNGGGGGTEWEARITGRVVDSMGVSCAKAIVRLIPSNYDPVAGSAISSLPTVTTDTAGYYTMNTMQTGIFSLNIAAHDKGYRSLVTGISIAKVDTIIVQNAIARKSGTIKITLPAGVNLANGYYFIPGTGIYALLEENSTMVALDSVPAGVNLSIYYAVKGSSAQPQLIRDSVVVAPGGITNIEYIGWKFLKKLILNTTASGAGVAGTVTNFPVLVRLTGTNFAFENAGPGGADLRFTKSDGTPINYEIEQWDSSSRQAAIWVKIDTVFGNDNSHYINMYWGASNATSASNSAAVFDTSDGFQGVWHLNQPTGSLEKDATYNHFDGTPSAIAPILTDGSVGTAKQFDGTSSFFDMKNTAAGKLNFPENGTYTISAWAYADTLDDSFHVVAGKSDEQYYLKLKQYYPPNPMRWEFVEFHNQTGWQITDSIASARTWTYIVGIRSGVAQYFFVNGVPVDSTIELKSDADARRTGDDFTIGKYLSTSVNVIEGKCPFKGKIDEVRISSRARSADWIKLCFMNQKETDALVQFK